MTKHQRHMAASVRRQHARKLLGELIENGYEARAHQENPSWRSRLAWYFRRFA